MRTSESSDARLIRDAADDYSKDLRKDDKDDKDDNEPVVYETRVEAACVRMIGQLLCILVGVLLFAALLAEITIPGVTDMPSYADNLLYASIAHHFEGVHARLYATSPPPPPAF